MLFTNVSGGIVSSDLWDCSHGITGDASMVDVDKVNVTEGEEGLMDGQGFCGGLRLRLEFESHGGIEVVGETEVVGEGSL